MHCIDVAVLKIEIFLIRIDSSVDNSVREYTSFSNYDGLVICGATAMATSGADRVYTHIHLGSTPTTTTTTTTWATTAARKNLSGRILSYITPSDICTICLTGQVFAPESFRPQGLLPNSDPLSFVLCSRQMPCFTPNSRLLSPINIQTTTTSLHGLGHIILY